jgi:hypothetical protein
LLTQTHSIRVDEPAESSVFKLSLDLSKEEAYEGEPVVLTAVWYFRDTARYYNYLFPILNHPDILDGAFVEDQANDTLVLPFGTGRVPVEMGNAKLDGVNFNTITYRQYIIPQRAGYYNFPRGTVQLWRPKKSYSSNPNDYETMVVASRGIRLRVRGLPDGRPTGFTGLVGEDFSVSTSASPVEVNVGDPITFSITLSGASNLDNALLPQLDELPTFEEQFAFISYRSAERMEGENKVFTRVIRARSQEVLEIPPVEIVYFNTKSRSYEVAASSPIPLIVRSTRVLMNEEIEGETAGIRAGRIRSSEAGINFNYEGAALLIQDRHETLVTLFSPLVLVMLMTPVLGFGIVFGLSLLKTGRTNRSRVRRQRQMLHDLKMKARKLEAGELAITEQALLENCIELIGLKLGFPKMAMTYGDVERELRLRMIDTDILPELETLFDLFDRSRYGSDQGNEGRVQKPGLDSRSLSSLVLRISRELERRIPR